MSGAPSRYAGAAVMLWTDPGGRRAPYLARRLLPALSRLPGGRVHVIRAGERADTIAAAELGDAELGWMLADANPVMRPSELERPGRAVRIPLSAPAQGGPLGQ